MSTPVRAPRIWIDVEHGARFGSPVAGIDTFREFSQVTAPVREVWLFHDRPAPLLRGFYYPVATHQRFAVPRGAGPGMVVIDRNGDQMWFSGASCGPGVKAEAAARILAEIGWAIPRAASDENTSPLAPFDEMHFVDGHLAGRPAHRPPGARRPARPHVRSSPKVGQPDGIRQGRGHRARSPTTVGNGGRARRLAGQARRIRCCTTAVDEPRNPAMTAAN